MRQDSSSTTPIHGQQFPGEKMTRTGFLGPIAKARGFTLIEMLVATFVLVIILGMTLQITNYANNLFLSTRKRVDAFQEARAGFEVMTRKISQAMLNTYWDYANGTVGSGTGAPRPQPDFSTTGKASAYTTASGTWQPTQYLRNSQLHFVCGPTETTSATLSGTTVNTIVGLTANGSTSTNPVSRMVGNAIFFQAPVGYSDSTSNAVMPNLLNTCGYFLQFSSDNPDRPTFLQNSAEPGYTGGSVALPLKFRFRLKELALPSQYMYAYQYISGQTNIVYPNWWYSQPLAKKTSNTNIALPFSPVYTLAQNVIALVIEPMRSSNYTPPNPNVTEIAPYYFYDSRSWDAPLRLTTPLSVATRNQLPPQVMVTMVAIDEASAARLQSQYGDALGSTMPTFSDAGVVSSPSLPNGLYDSKGTPQIFTQASSNVNNPNTVNDLYQKDLTNLEQALVNQHITYRVFSTHVTILQSKFSD